MPHGDKRTPAVRAATDASLRAERTKSDEEFARRYGEVTEDSDQVVQTARDRADVVLDTARRREDEKTSGRTTTQVKAERLREDETIAQEREAADTALETERVQRQIALASLLVDERLETDARLRLERARADETLTHRDDFLAMLSHDMRTLLGSVALSAEALKRQVQHDPTRVARTTGSIQRATAQLTRLVADLLDVASMDAGKFVLVRGLHDARRLVREATEAFEHVASSKELALSVEIPNEDLFTDFDPDRIAQVLANLLGNAAKFTHPGGRITVSVALRGHDICFSVSDTGEGIPADKLETIFDRYSQIGRTDRTGLGLGLYISQRIVEAHGGRLWVESVFGQGSTFFFTVPAHEKELRAPSQEHSASNPKSP
jgi:signal transduction histidine kinase